MSKKQQAAASTALATISDRFPALNPSDELREALAANLGGQTIGLSDLEKIRVPTGGGLAWEIPTITGEVDIAKTFDAIVIEWKATRAFYDTAYTGEKNPPKCASDDCITGKGEPGGECAACPMAKWGTAAEFNDQKRAAGSHAQACSERRLLFVLLPGSVLPVMVSLGPSAISVVKKHFLRLAAQGIPYYGVMTRFALQKSASGGIDFSLPVLSVAEQLDRETVTQIKGYADAIRPSLRRLRDDEAIHAEI